MSSDARSFDLVVVGSGPAGHKAAVQGAKAGRRILMVERAKGVGGECVHHGTIPSKTLRETAAYLAGLERRSSGVLSQNLSRDLRVQSLTQRLDVVLKGHERFLADQLARNGVEVWHGRASFVSPHEVEVTAPDRSQKRARGEFFILAPGSQPRTPANVPVDHENILDSDSILSLVYLPQSLIVLGAGVIACEFASLFAALGVAVTMVDKGDRPLAFLDPELTGRFLQSLSRMGGRFVPGRALENVRWDGLASVDVTFGGGEVLRAEKVLCALGRTANLSGLNLTSAGLEPNARGFLSVDENYRTSVAHIYAAGDVIGPPALAASAMAQGRHAVRHALGIVLDHRPEHTPVGIYTIPEMASVGLTEEQARERCGGAMIGRANYRELARGLINGDDEGLIKLVADSRGETLLGAHIVGDGATELIHLAQFALVAKMPLDVFVEQIFNFPTLAEGYRVAALEIAAQRDGALRQVG